MKLFKNKRETHPRPRVPSTAGSPTVHVGQLVEIAIEAWRVADRSRKLQVAAKREDPSIGFSIEKIQHVLKEIGIEIKDPAGEPYHEGMGLDVLTFDYNPDASPANRIVQETVSPAIYYNGKLIKMAKVIVGSAGGPETHAQNHD